MCFPSFFALQACLLICYTLSIYLISSSFQLYQNTYTAFFIQQLKFKYLLSGKNLVLYYQNGLKYFLKKYSHCYMSVFFSHKYFNFPTQIYSYWKPLYSHLTVGQSPLRNGVLLVITVRKVHWPMGKDSGWKTSRGHKRLIFVEKIGDFS